MHMSLTWPKCVKEFINIKQYWIVCCKLFSCSRIRIQYLGLIWHECIIFITNFQIYSNSSSNDLVQRTKNNILFVFSSGIITNMESKVAFPVCTQCQPFEFEKYVFQSEVINGKRNMKYNLSDIAVITVPADALAPLDVRVMICCLIHYLNLCWHVIPTIMNGTSTVPL